jgi:hypothetical protein
MTTARRAAAAMVVVLVVTAAAWWARGDGDDGPVDARTWEPLPRRVVVEVWNGGGSEGAARDAALRLRRGQLDVVGWGNAPEALRDTLSDSVRILVRLGDTTGVGRIAEVLGPARITEARDSTRLVDLTVVVPRVRD